MSWSGLTVATLTTITKTWADMVRNSVVNPFATVAARSSAITAPSDGMVSAQTDADCVDYYDGTTWAPIRTVTDALTVTAASPVITGASFSPEAEISSKLRLTIPQVRTGELWLVGVQFYYVPSTTGSDWTFRLREDSTSGTVVGAQYMPNPGGSMPHVAVFPWVPAANATSKLLVSTIIRNVGAATLAVHSKQGSDQAMFAWAARVGASGAFRSVP